MTSPFQSLNNLEEIYFIGGTEYTITFVLYDTDGIPIDIPDSSASWCLSSISQPDIAILSKLCSNVSASVVEVLLDKNDTLNLSGKFIQQPIIQDAEGYTFRPGQGVVTIATASR